MNLSLRRLSVLTVALLSALALSASAAFAQYPPASAFGVSCTEADAGETSTCSVGGAAPNELLTATAEYNPVFYEDTFNADADGNASFSFEIPEEAGDSPVTVTVSGAVSGSAGDTVNAAQVDEDGDEDGTPVAGTGTLPMTGTQVGVLLAIALTMLGGGLLALRRREDSKVTA